MPFLRIDFRDLFRFFSSCSTAQVHNRQGQASQSLQIAPFDPNYTYGNTSATTTFYDPTDTVWNSYTGGAYQEAVSALSTIPDKAYEGYSAPEYTTFGMEYSPDYDGNGSGELKLRDLSFGLFGKRHRSEGGAII